MQDTFAHLLSIDINSLGGSGTIVNHFALFLHCPSQVNRMSWDNVHHGRRSDDGSFTTQLLASHWTAIKTAVCDAWGLGYRGVSMGVNCLWKTPDYRGTRIGISMNILWFPWFPWFLNQKTLGLETHLAHSRAHAAEPFCRRQNLHAKAGLEMILLVTLRSKILGHPPGGCREFGHRAGLRRS